MPDNSATWKLLRGLASQLQGDHLAQALEDLIELAAVQLLHCVGDFLFPDRLLLEGSDLTLAMWICEVKMHLALQHRVAHSSLPLQESLIAKALKDMHRAEKTGGWDSRVLRKGKAWDKPPGAGLALRLRDHPNGDVALASIQEASNQDADVSCTKILKTHGLRGNRQHCGRHLHHKFLHPDTQQNPAPRKNTPVIMYRQKQTRETSTVHHALMHQLRPSSQRAYKACGHCPILAKTRQEQVTCRMGPSAMSARMTTTPTMLPNQARAPESENCWRPFSLAKTSADGPHERHKTTQGASGARCSEKCHLHFQPRDPN